jgi:uncharacterized protein (DUF983 family)
MKCPSCRNFISKFKLKPVFYCPHCENKLQVANHTKAILISFGVFILISILSWVTIIFHESAVLSFLIEVLIGVSISIFTYNNVSKLEAFAKDNLDLRLKCKK